MVAKWTEGGCGGRHLPVPLFSSSKLSRHGRGRTAHQSCSTRNGAKHPSDLPYGMWTAKATPWEAPVADSWDCAWGCSTRSGRRTPGMEEASPTGSAQSSPKPEYHRGSLTLRHPLPGWRPRWAAPSAPPTC